MHPLRETDAFVVNESRRLRVQIDEREEQLTRVRSFLGHLEAQQDADTRMLEELEALLELSPQLRLESLDRRLRGQRLQEVAIELLHRELGAGHPVHYRDWYALVRRAGHEVAGKNPLGSFLTQIARAPDVERVGERTGLYRLRARRRAA